MIKRPSVEIQPSNPGMGQRSSQKHKTMGAFRNSFLNKIPQAATELNIPHVPSPLLRKRDSQRKKTVSFIEKNEERRTSLSPVLKNSKEDDDYDANPQKNEPSPENDNPLNYKINPLQKLESENDIDAENLQKFTKRFPSQKFTLVKTENSEFYKISTIREESDSENDSKKDSKKEIKTEALGEKKATLIPKYSSKFLIDELFGEKDDSLDSGGSNDNESSQNSEEEENKYSRKSTKKKKIPKIDSNNKEKNKIIYNYLQDFLNPTIDNKDDIHENIEENTKLKKEITAIPQLFRQHTKLITKRKADCLKVVNMNPLERIHIDYDVFPDQYPLRKLRKYFFLSLRYFIIIIFR